MKTTEFREKLGEVADRLGYPKEAATAFANVLLRRVGEPDEYDLAAGERLLSELSPLLSDRAQRADEKEIYFPRLPRPRSTEALLQRTIGPWAEALRHELFGTLEAPFKDDTDAAGWLWNGDMIRHPRTIRDEHSVWTSSSAPDFRQLNALAQLGMPYNVTVPGPTIGWRFRWLPDDEPEQMSFLRHSAQGRALAETQEMAEYSGYRIEDLLLHLLCDKPLVLAPAAVELATYYRPTGEARPREQVTIRLYAPPSYPDMRKLHKAIRERWKAVEPGKALLREVVEERIGPPDNRVPHPWSDSHWEAIASEWEVRMMERIKPGTLRARYRYMIGLDRKTGKG